MTDLVLLKDVDDLGSLYAEPESIDKVLDGIEATVRAHDPDVSTAKGRGELAERIVETAREHDVAIEQNAILAQALSAVELDDEIPEELYRATAQVIAFVLSLRGELSRLNRNGHKS